MKRRLLWYSLAAIAALSAAALYLWSRDEQRLQGLWEAQDGSGARLTFDGNLAVLEGERFSEPRRTLFRLDPSATPKRIIICDASAPDAPQPRRFLGLIFSTSYSAMPDQECRGIYELKGDYLRICMPPPGADFPTAFDSAAGLVLELRRR